MKRLFPSLLALCLVLPLLAAPARANDDAMKSMMNRVTDFTLDNGMTFIVVEDHDAPVARFFIQVDAGSVDEHWGITGMAHMFEHMAFKGSETVGATDIAAEKAAIAEEEKVFNALRLERQKRVLADPAKVKELEEAFRQAQDRAVAYVRPNDFSEIYEMHGAVGLNAFTSWDMTGYIVALPANKLELWFAMDSERFLHPVLREFYKERDVVKEERRMRTDNRPWGRLIEDMLATAYRAHPYGSPTIGYYSDLDSFTREEAEEFRERYYVASNMTAVVVGDVDPAECRRLAEQYFGRLPKRPKPEPVESAEVEPLGEHRVVHTQGESLLGMAFLTVEFAHPDYLPLDVFARILSNGRTSRFNKKLVEEKQTAVQAGAFIGLPGEKYPTLYVMYGVISPASDHATVEAGIWEIVRDIQENGVTEAELQRVKTQAYAEFVRDMDRGIGQQLANFQVLTGSWRNLFDYPGRINAITAADVQRVARQYLQPRRAVVGIIDPKAAAPVK